MKPMIAEKKPESPLYEINGWGKVLRISHGLRNGFILILEIPGECVGIYQLKETSHMTYLELYIS